jgi:hypothetical protein
VKFWFGASLFESSVRKFTSALASSLLISLLFAMTGCGSGSQTSSSSGAQTPDFTLTVAIPDLSLAEGGTQTGYVTASGINGFTGAISISISGLPSGVTANSTTFSLSAPGIQAITFSAAANAPAVSTATVTVQAVSGSITHTTSFSITVLGPPTFTLSLQPSSLILDRSTSNTIQVSAKGVNGFTGLVTVSISGLPTGVTASQTTFYLPANSSTVITLTAGATASGTATIQFNGSSGSLVASTSLALTVSTAPDFALSSGIFTAAGVYASATASVTITAAGVNGFTAPINVSLSGLPTGVTASPTTFVLNPGSSQAVIFSAALNAPSETNAEILVQGVSGSLSHTTQFNLIVLPLSLNLSAQPASITIPAGSSALAEVQISGTEGSTQGSIAFQVTGLPIGVTATPSNATLPGIGASQDVIFSAGNGATGGTATLKATFGSATSSATITINIGPPPSITPVQLKSRSKLVRTDANADFAGYPPPNWTVYDSATKRFFSSDYGLGRINVLDETTETVVASLAIPGAFGIDLAPDNGVLYVGTLSGDLYLVDPVNLVVTKRYLSSSIGASGFAANAVYALANGQLLLQPYFLVPGYSWVDGNGVPEIWNPSTNSMTQLTGLSPARGNCSESYEFGLLTSGRTRFVMTPTLTSEGSSNLCSIDLSTLNVIVSPTLQSDGSNSSLTTLAVSPDGNTIATFDGTTIWILDAATLTVKKSFAAGVSQTVFNYPSMVIGSDNQTIYLTGDPQYSFIYVYNSTTGQQTGWLPAIQAPTGINSEMYAPIIQAISGSGLLGGVIDQGFGLIDTTQVKPLPTGVPFEPSPLSPTYGPVQGGTDLSWMESGYGFSNATHLGSIYFGGVPATNISSSTVLGDFLYATTPAGMVGPADVVTLTTDGGEQYIPEGYSYGPWVVENTTMYATADGGGPASLYGYGFGANYAVDIDTRMANPPAELQITVGGQSARLTGYYPEAFQLADYDYEPFPLEGIEYTMPPGVAGTSSAIVVTNSTGSNTVKAGVTYLPATQSFPVNGQLLDGLYDSHRDVYYFSDVNEVRVFSRTLGEWLPPIPIPAPAGAYGAQRLFGLALSPDGSKLAISDSGAIAVYVLNPDFPNSIQSFAFASQISPVSQYAITGTPSGVTITNSGQVWFAAYDQDGDGSTFLYALNTTTGKISAAGSSQTQGNYPFGRLAMTADGSKFYVVNAGLISYVNTSTGEITSCKECGDLSQGGFDIVLSANQTSLYADGLLLDDLLNLQGFQSLNYRESFDADYVYGATLSPDGTLLFQPGEQSIDVFDGRTGNFRARVSLPVSLSPNYRALVGDGKDNVQVAITGATGNGIAVIDLSSLQEPSALPYFIRSKAEGSVQAALAKPAATTDAAAISTNTVGPLRAARHRRWHYHINLAKPKLTAIIPGSGAQH